MSDSNNKLFDEVAKVFGNMLGAVGNAKNELEAGLRSKVQNYLQDMDLVSREEFEVLKHMIAKSRLEQEELHRRVNELETEVRGNSNGNKDAF
jgi:BMFP domain-containing protein YqiC